MRRSRLLVGATYALAIGSADLAAQPAEIEKAARRLVDDGRVYRSRDISCTVYDATGRGRDAFTTSDASPCSPSPASG